MSLLPTTAADWLLCCRPRTRGTSWRRPLKIVADAGAADAGGGGDAARFARTQGTAAVVVVAAAAGTPSGQQLLAWRSNGRSASDAGRASVHRQTWAVLVEEAEGRPWKCS